MDTLWELARDTVQKAADHIRRSAVDITVLTEEAKDIKVNLDHETNEIICSELTKAGLPILSEESPIEFEINQGAGLYWIVDPLDGSYNLLKGYGAYCISVALFDGLVPVFGLVYDLQNNKFIASQAGKSGIEIEGQPFTLDNNNGIGKSVLYTGIPVGLSALAVGDGQFYVDLSKYKKVRMIGSAATSLSLVAQGMADVYIEKNIYLWDVAAGMALVNAAGGACFVSWHNEQPHLLDIVAAGSTALAGESTSSCLWDVEFKKIENTGELSL